MRLKFLVIISAAYLVLISAILFMGLRRETAREEFWIKENSSLQLHTINDNVGLEIEKLKVEAIRVAAAMEANQKEDAVKTLSLFSGIGAVSADVDNYLWKVDNGHKVDPGTGAENAKADLKSDIWNGPWLQRAKEIAETESQPRFFAVQINDDNIGSIIKTAVFFAARIKDKNSAVKRNVRLVGILAQPLFQNILASQQNAGMQFFIFSQKGLAVAHTISDYVGNSLAGDKLYEEIRRNKIAIGNFSHNDFKGSAVVSMFEKIENTDLTVVAQLRPSQWAVIDWGYYGQSFMLVLGIFCLLTGAMFFVIPKEIGKTKEILVEKIVEKIIEKPVERIVERTIEVPVTASASISALAPVRLSQLSQVNVSESDGQVPPIPKHIYEKMVRSTLFEHNAVSTLKATLPPLEATPSTSTLPAKMAILAKVISQIKAPFLSILGHVQIAKAHPQGGSLQAIENEARSAREVLDRLSQFSGLSQPPTITVPLIDLIDSALRSLEGPLLRGAIKINKNVAEELVVKCDPDDFRFALIELFRNAIESMERVLRKELNIEAFQKGKGLIELKITDTGEGILPRNIPFLFEPFYSTKSPLDHKGLGLAAAQGIMRTHLGELSITSDPDQGSVAKVSVPFSFEIPKKLSEFQMMSRPAWMELVKTPSKLDIAAVEAQIEPIEIKKSYTLDENDVDFELKGFEFISKATDSIQGSDSSDFDSIDDDAKTDSFSFEEISRLKSGVKTEVEEIHKEVEKSLLFASPVKRLKKKSEPLDKLKVQIPRPEEKL
jgi:signal transduction histidine kinase